MTSGSAQTGASNLDLVPRQPAPWMIPSTGYPTPAFYRFIVNLLSLAGGNAPATLEDLEILLFTQPEISAATVNNLEGEVAKLRALIAMTPPHVPDLTMAVNRLAALVAMIPHTPDLSDRVSRLETLVYGRVV